MNSQLRTHRAVGSLNAGQCAVPIVRQASPSVTKTQDAWRSAPVPMAILLTVATLVAAPMLLPEPSHAFGSGFPGYDINMDGRKRAMERNKREMKIEQDKAVAFKAAKLAKQAALAQQAQ